AHTPSGTGCTPACSARPAVASHTARVAGATRRCSAGPPEALTERPPEYPHRLCRACRRSSRRALTHPAPLPAPARARRAEPRRVQGSTVRNSAVGVHRYTAGVPAPTPADHGGPYRAADRQRTDCWWPAQPAVSPGGPLSEYLTGPSARSPRLVAP